MNCKSSSYKIVIRVDAKEGEQDTSIHSLSEYDLEVLGPLLENIKAHQGFFLAGRRPQGWEPSAKDLYKGFLGWDIFVSLLPKPIHGFSNILYVEIYSGNPYKMEML